MDVALFWEHLYLSLVPCLLSFATGGTAGLFIGHFLAPKATKSKALRTAAIMVPWRSVAICSPIACFLLLSPQLIGWGYASWALVGAFALPLSFVLGISCELNGLLPFHPWSQFVSGARTIAVFSVVVHLPAALFGSGGGGRVLLKGVRTGTLSDILRGVVIVAVIALLVDFAFGVVELVIGGNGASS